MPRLKIFAKKWSWTAFRVEREICSFLRDQKYNPKKYIIKVSNGALDSFSTVEITVESDWKRFGVDPSGGVFQM